ncbi:MAG: M28 family peptidase [Phycisphaerales bacterium]
MTAAAQAAASSERQPRDVEWPGIALRVIVLIVAVAAGSVIGLRGLETPQPAPADADSFSAIRAAKFAQAVLGDQPRPAGSEANAEAARRLSDWLRARGLEVESSDTKVRAAGRDVTIRNVVARKTGAMPGSAILLCAHIDSAPGSPGAGDDGFGVAVLLEAAAALGTGPWPGRDIILLFTDAEESGLLGARQFVSNHPWHAKVGTVINVDNRGNAGPSILYDLCGDSADVLQSCSPALGPVVGSSLYAEIASRMPNSSDLAVFREAGMSGMNFALVGGHEHYHASTDTWSQANLSSLQHQGEIAMMAMQALALHRADTPRAEGRAIYQDVAGAMLAWWPARTGVTASFLCVGALGATGLVVCRRNAVKPRDLAMGWVAALVRFIVAGLVTWILLLAAEWGGLFGMAAAKIGMPDAGLADRYRAAFWPSHGPALLAVVMLAGLVGGALAARPLLRNRQPLCTFIGGWSTLAVFVAILAIVLPGASAPLLPIVLVISLVLVALTLVVEHKQKLAVLATLALGGFLAGLFLAPIECLGWIGVGLSMPPFAALRAAVLALVLLPVLTPGVATATTR